MTIETLEGLRAERDALRAEVERWKTDAAKCAKTAICERAAHAEALRVARAEERERCARVVLSMLTSTWPAGSDLWLIDAAQRIRALNPAPPEAP